MGSSSEGGFVDIGEWKRQPDALQIAAPGYIHCYVERTSIRRYPL